MKVTAIRNKESTTYTDLMDQTAATGIAEAGKVEAAGIVGKHAQAAQAQGQAAIMEGISGIASSAIGAFGGGRLPAVGTQARADADMKTGNYTQADMNACGRDLVIK